MPHDMHALQLERQLCFPLYAASNLIQRWYRPLLQPLGLTYSQYLVMLVLWQSSGVAPSVGELCQTLHLDVGTLSPLLKRMERAGLIRREQAPDDHRRVLVGLTAAGRALQAPASEVPERLSCQLGIDPEPLAMMRDQLRALVARLSQPQGEG